jgi:hypothetical protein
MEHCMNKKPSTCVPEVRVTLKLYGDEYPDLAQALKLTRKGQPRTKRLTFLAALGLIFEKSGLPAPIAAVAPSPLRDPPAEQLTTGNPSTFGYQPMLSESELSDLFEGVGKLPRNEGP